MNPRRVLSHFYYNAQHRHQPSRTFPHRRAGHTPSNPDRTHSAEIHSVLKRRFPYRMPVFPRHHGTLAQAARALGALRGSCAGGGRGPGERRGEAGRGGRARGNAAARETPNTARALSSPQPRAERRFRRATASSLCCRPAGFAPLARHPRRPPGPHQTRLPPHREGARSNRKAQQRSEHRAGKRKEPAAHSPSETQRGSCASGRTHRSSQPQPRTRTDTARSKIRSAAILLPPAGRGPNMAARGPPGAAMAAPEPEPGRCAHFVLRKKRFCRMIPAPGRRFCGEHGHEEVQGPLSGQEGGREGGWRGSACAFPGAFMCRALASAQVALPLH